MVSDKPTTNTLSGDPRRPDSVVPYDRPPAAEDKVNVLLLAGVLLSTLSLAFRVRWCSLIALACLGSAYTRRSADTDKHQMIISAMFCYFSIFLSHLTPGNKSAAAAPAIAAAGGPK
ncbi:hypothetical protein Agub_g8480 [Astrephomene gubernaculifera]|uniref:Protein Asterix n=1 Tax=Astrephomene gubernaculifera TaxID=47775 RepID=A0AAD3DUF0_9CHLO|nr:hypothetical protein Agub_g8480 [Astrephomene gubernaculifera]